MMTVHNGTGVTASVCLTTPVGWVKARSRPREGGGSCTGVDQYGQVIDLQPGRAEAS